MREAAVIVLMSLCSSLAGCMGGIRKNYAR